MAVTVIGHVVATSFLLDTSAGRPGRDSAKLSAAADVQRPSVDVHCREIESKWSRDDPCLPRGVLSFQKERKKKLT
jgi:hypothetical protein